jgi:hypothetical protein
VFNRRHRGYGVYCFFLPAARNNCDYHNGTSSDQSVTDPVENAALQNNRWRGTKKSAEDRGLSI